MIAATPCYQRNIAALSRFQPAVAAMVDAAAIPDGVTPATGRDGSSTFQIPTEQGDVTWFGGSSMPSVSAAEMFWSFAGDGSNVLLPGVLTGVEPLLLARKMPIHSALFIVDDSCLHIKLALHLHDYAGLVDAGRLVFVLGENLADALRAFFEDHPGYELPTQLATVAHRSAAELADLQRQLELAGEGVLGVHGRVVESISRSIRDREPGPLPPEPRVAVLSVDARPAVREQVARIEQALSRLGWDHQVCIPDSPAKCHVAARLGAVDGVSADLVLLVNCTAGSMRALLPSDLPVVSWYLPDAIVPSDIRKEISPDQVLFVSCEPQYRALVAAGANETAVERMDVGADDAGCYPIGDRGQKHGEGWSEAAVLMNLPDDRPEAAGITLPSHLRLWESLQDEVARRIDDYRPGLGVEILDKAQRKSGTTVQDPLIGERFVALVEARVVPACAGRAALDALRAAGRRVTAWGDNWGVGDDKEPRAHGPIPTGPTLNTLFNSTDVVVLPDSSAASVQTALDALASGTHVVCARPDTPFEQLYPALADVAPYMHFYSSRRELAEIVQGLVSTAEPVSTRLDAGRLLVKAKHTVAGRLGEMLDRLRARRTPVVGGVAQF